MRQKRAKSYKKQMLVYTHTFKFREPYQVLFDNLITEQSHSSSFELLRMLKRTIQATEIKPMITQCCMEALYTTKNEPLIQFAKNEFERRKCNHRTPVPPGECIHSVVDIQGLNKHRYVVATQDVELRKKLRKVPGVPLIYMNRSVMVMEPLSDASREYSQKWESGKLSGGLNDSEAGKIKKRDDVEKNNNDEEGEGANDEPAPKKKKLGPKGPNPLSVKKKKKTNSNELAKQDEKEKKPTRRRKHRKANATSGEGEVNNDDGKREVSDEGEREVNNESKDVIDSTPN